MAVTIPLLLFFFLVLGVLVCLLVLLFISHSRRTRIWYGIFLASFIGWVLQLVAEPSMGGMVYVFPLLWIVFTFYFGFSSAGLGRGNLPDFSASRREPLMTQEQLLGPAGTRQALTLYFTLALLALMLSLLFFTASSMRP